MKTIIETAMEFFQTQLKQSDSSKQYLINRGFTEDDFDDIGVGHNPGYEVTVNHLQRNEFTQTEIDAVFPNLKALDSYQIVIPYYDPEGILKSIWGRLSIPGNPYKDQSTYLPFTDPAPKDTLFNLHKVKGKESVVLVEGFFDALLAYQRGVAAVAAADSYLRKEQIETAIGINHMTLVFDNDEAGEAGMEKAILDLANADIASDVFNYPAEFQSSGTSIKDPADFINHKGVESFKKSLDFGTEDSWFWYAFSFIDNHQDLDLFDETIVTEIAKSVVVLPEVIRNILEPDLREQLPTVALKVETLKRKKAL